MKILLFLILFILSAKTFCQNIINVPSQFSTIQSAINSAVSGDTILVEPGIYKENIFWTKINGIKLVSAGDTSNTIIDGQKLSSVIYFNSDGVIDSNTIIDGFKIINGGEVSNGGGITLINSSPLIKNSTIANCISSKLGGGIYCSVQSNPIIRNTSIYLNISGDGGGIFVNNATLNLTNVSLLKNKATNSGSGGGLSTQNSSITISNSLINNNNSIVGGGIAINAYSENTTIIENSEISGNDAAQSGGGIYAEGYAGNIFLNDVTISNNSSGEGGGICFRQTKNLSFFSMRFLNNQAQKGGGIYFASTDTISNAYFYGNVATYGGGIFSSGDIKVQDVSLVRNIGDYGSAIYVGNFSSLDVNKTTFSNNKHFAIYFNDLSNGGKITNSNFFKNNYAIYNLNNANIINSSSNYWGSSDGPFHAIQNNIGLGDTLNNFTNVIPFFTIPEISAPPIPVQNLRFTESNDTSISLIWDNSIINDLSGYKLYFGTDTAKWEFDNSIDVGNVNAYSLFNYDNNKTYYFSVTCYDIEGNESWFSELAKYDTPVGIEEKNTSINETFKLYQNYPNPFNPATRIKYSIPQRGFVILKVYNILGKEITTLVNSEKVAGTYEVEFVGDNLASGVYFYIMQIGDFIDSKKIILVK